MSIKFVKLYSDDVEFEIKEKNNVHALLEGDYQLKIKGNEINLTKDKILVATKCRPDRNFNLSVGIMNCFEKMYKELNKNIEVGDTVIINDTLHVFPKYLEWAYKYLNFEDVKNFQYGIHPAEGLFGKVIAIHKHLDFSNQTLVALKTNEHKVYIIGIEGLR